MPGSSVAIRWTVTDAERAPWRSIALCFGWVVGSGRYAPSGYGDFSAPLRRLAAAWYTDASHVASCLQPLFAVAVPTPVDERRDRSRQGKDHLRLTQVEAMALTNLAAHFGISYGPMDRPFPIEAIRRIGKIYMRDHESEQLVLECLRCSYIVLNDPFERIGLN